MKKVLTLLNRFIFGIQIFRRFQYSKDIIYTDEYKLNEKGKKLLYQFREEIEESSFPYDITKIKSEFDNHIIARAAYLRGFILGYIGVKRGECTTFPFHGENQEFQSALKHGFYHGQYYGLSGEKPY
jgi:hypothetical protein